ncbi:PilZ domain-containing protein [Zooshikella marina]|uniref:PilZ domain-containing protein n=1 Tax=Zooshikella ganghwensis TaxID=202772 RepID=A0A4V1INS5_9GAMM|nr:PilZ domain-containing protein [Zooshikella ganghwensis]MBU2707598.1 PilZ domain-containing protein [Zooshikella ganghwensis]RDH44751.1 PilZ domain-containing protein [Zooshikella ganghwensis]
MTEKRRTDRTKVTFVVEVTIPEGDSKRLKTQDISDGGVFLLADDFFPELGTVVDIQVVGLPGGDAPRLQMEVVRHTDNGFGLRMINKDRD